MSKPRIAINGFGRIGRMVLKVLLQKGHVEVVAINDLADVATMAHLLKYDSVHGPFNGQVLSENDKLSVNGQNIRALSISDPEALPWGKLNIDAVLECTGRFRKEEDARSHLRAGARKVILSAPPQSGHVKTVVLGINDDIISGDEEIISNASCTTNCAAPLVSLVDELCGIRTAYITTVHSYTNDQRLHDGPHKDMRRARAAAQSIIPTTTGAAKAITKIFPHLNDKIGGCGIRVPVPDGSLTDITCIVDHPVPVERVNDHFHMASATKLNGIMAYTEDPIVGIDVVGNPHSCLFDALLTSVIDNMVKVVGWYDNEAGYSNRLAELCERMLVD